MSSGVVKINPVVPTANPKNMFVVKALDKYKAKSKEELSFTKGDLILVYEESNEGLYKGEILHVGKTPKTHVIGWFPSYYAKKEDKESRPTSTQPTIEVPVIKRTSEESGRDGREPTSRESKDGNKETKDGSLRKGLTHSAEKKSKFSSNRSL